jgi:hypothetical protein
VVTVKFQILALHNCITDENKAISSFSFFLSFFLEVIWREISHLKTTTAQAGTLCQFTKQQQTCDVDAIPYR